MTDIDQKLVRAASLLRQQTAKIKELEAEVERLNGVVATSHDALKILQDVYSDPRSSDSAKLKAAAAAIGYERSKPMAVNATIDGAALFGLLEAKRLAKRKARLIEATPRPDPAA